MHLDEMAGLLYIERQMDPERSREMAAHLEACAACRTLLHALQSETTLLSTALTEDTEPLPARLISERVRGIPSWIWTLAFGGFAAGAYWLWTDGIGPWMDQLSNAGLGGTDLVSTMVFSGAFWEGWSDMIDAIQIGALILLAAAVLVWLRRRMRRSVAVAVVMTAMLLALAIPQAASAADVRRGRSIVVPVGEVVHNDLVVAGPSVRIEGTVEGDVIAATRDLTVTGHVTGDVIAAAQYVTIDGTVDGNVRIASNVASLAGSIGKNAAVIGSIIDLTSRGSVGGGMIAIGGRGDLSGKIQRDLLGVLGRADLEGFIGGDELIRGGNLAIASTAEIRGTASFAGPQEPTVESGAKLASPLRTEITQEVRRNRRSAARSAIRAIFSYAGALLVGILLYVVFPGFFRAALREATGIGLPIGVGALALITAVFLVVVGILLMLVGIGAGIAGLLGYAPILYIAQVFVGMWLGNKIMGEAPPVVSAVFGRMAVGLLILHVVRLVPVLGALIGIVVLMWGTGAVLMGFYRMSRAEPVPAPVAA